VAQVGKDEDMKLRIDHIDDETSPGDLKKLLARFGNIKEVAIYVGGSVVYGIVTMPDSAAKRLKNRRAGIFWRGRCLSIEIADESLGPWLPAWKPPKNWLGRW
jgi:hypothetical protein